MMRRPLKLKVNRRKLISAIRAERDRRLKLYKAAQAEFKNELKNIPKRVRESIDRHIQYLNNALKDMRTLKGKIRDVDFTQGLGALSQAGFYNRGAFAGFTMPYLSSEPKKTDRMNNYGVSEYGFDSAGNNVFDKIIMRLELSDEESIEVTEDDNYFQYIGA
jgi:hypothetical protein